MNKSGPAAPPITENDAGLAQQSKVVVAGADGSHALSYGDRPPAPGRSKLQAILDVFRPNQAVSGRTMSVIIAVEVVIALLVWLNSPFKVLPRPDEVLGALRGLWMQEGLGQELIISFKTNLEALLWTVILSLGLAYLTVIPVFRPVVAAVSKGRFLSLVGFTFIFTLIFGGGHPLKTSLLVFAVTVFYVTSMASVVAAIPREEFDHARTLRMSEWRVVWEVVVLGTADKALEVLRQNAAMGWMMLTMVEGIVRSEGGVGAMLLGESKHFRLAEVFAIQIVILVVGLLQDYGIGLIRRVVCPYAYLTLERQ
ncbi:MAG: nitrate ABC transporter permease [Armatimonadota bacterium]|nr:nitrate ABC transporter permease [Armatimonadota bacterium]